VKSEPPSSRVGGLQSLHEDVPPAALCVVCGRIDCDGGCYFEADPLEDVIPWDRWRTLRALWQSCAQTAEPPDLWLERAIKGDVVKALAFALLVEVAAVGSYVLLGCVALVSLLAYFDVRWHGLGAAGLALGTTLGLGVFMVALHVVWAAFLEVLLRLRGVARQWNTLLVLACYSCGWDLITSPAGLVAAWYVSGRREAWRLLRGATSNPTAACVYYLHRVRFVSAHSATRLAFTAAVLAVLSGIGASAAILWGLVPQWWQALI
jgi:hypothetical protein